MTVRFCVTSKKAPLKRILSVNDWSRKKTLREPLEPTKFNRTLSLKKLKILK